MKPYPKIQTVFKRDTSGKNLLMGVYSLPEFDYLRNNVWTWTEKVDGTNIRIMFEDGKMRIGGKSDRAQIPTFLLDVLNEMFDAEKLGEVFSGDTGPYDACLYGEGYGAKIQKGGERYKADGVSFVLFDVKVGDWWLKRCDVVGIATALGIEAVPFIGQGSGLYSRGGTLIDMISFVRKGFRSMWGDFTAEGVVAVPVEPLYTRSGERIITKLKHKDFKGVIE